MTTTAKKKTSKVKRWPSQTKSNFEQAFTNLKDPELEAYVYGLMATSNQSKKAIMGAMVRFCMKKNFKMEVKELNASIQMLVKKNEAKLKKYKLLAKKK